MHDSRNGTRQRFLGSAHFSGGPDGSQEARWPGPAFSVRKIFKNIIDVSSRRDASRSRGSGAGSTNSTGARPTCRPSSISSTPHRDEPHPSCRRATPLPQDEAHAYPPYTSLHLLTPPYTSFASLRTNHAHPSGRTTAILQERTTPILQRSCASNRRDETGPEQRTFAASTFLAATRG
jgi:hypothetical protein